MRRSSIAGTALAVLMLFATIDAAKAQEGTHYAPGIFNIQDFAVPPPGFYAQNFLVYYTTDEFRDRNGNKVKDIDLGAGPVPVDIEVDAVVIYPAAYWITDKKVLGADFGIVVGLPFQNTDIEASLPTLGLNADESTFGVGDIMIQPALLGWHFGPWDWMAGYVFYAPTGRYKEGETDNLGLGYWTHELQGSVVYHGGEDRLWTIGSMLSYDFHTNRQGVDIRPGDTFSFEWGISRIFPRFMIELGLTGYSQVQTTDDTGSDVVRDRDIHDQVHAIGFQTSWTSKSQKLNIAFRYLNEIYAEDRFKGQLSVMTISYAF